MHMCWICVVHKPVPAELVNVDSKLLPVMLYSPRGGMLCKKSTLVTTPLSYAHMLAVLAHMPVSAELVTLDSPADPVTLLASCPSACSFACFSKLTGLLLCFPVVAFLPNQCPPCSQSIQFHSCKQPCVPPICRFPMGPRYNYSRYPLNPLLLGILGP
jgi:hypothetical protein